MSDILGKHVYSAYKDLINAVSSFDFENRLYNCKDVWNTREAEYLRPGQLSFFDYFVQQYSKVFENTMLTSTHTAAGLGCPPHHQLQREFKCHHQKESAMRELVLSQRDEVIRSLSGHGNTE